MSLRRSLLAGLIATVAATATLGLAQTPSVPLGTILGVTAGDGLTGGGTIGNVTLTQYTGVNPQLGTTYTLLAADRAKLVTFSNLSAVAVALPAATGTFGAGFAWWASCYGPGQCDLTPQSGQISGGASLSLLAGNAAYVVSDGGNWQAAMIGSVGGSGITLTGDVHGSGTNNITTTVLAVNGVNYPSSVLAPIGTVPFITSTGQITYVSPATLISAGTLGLGTMAFQNANAVAITGGTGIFSGLTATTLAANLATFTTLTAARINGGFVAFSPSAVALSVSANATVSGVNTGDQTITLSGAVSGSGTGAITTTLAPVIVFTANMAPIITSRVIGNATGGSASPQETTVTQVLDFLAVPTTGSFPLRNASAWTVLTPSSTSGQVLTSNGASALPTWQTPGGGSGFTRVELRRFQSSGTYTPTTGMVYVVVYVTGGGGAGGGGSATQGGGGGGASGTGITVYSSARVGVSTSVTIGAAGAAGAANTTGGTGGSSAFGQILFVPGGFGGIAGGAGSTRGGTPSTPTQAILNIGGGWGGSSLAAMAGGSGGASYWGGGGAGGVVGDATGTDSSARGGGGGGAYISDVAGNGLAGVVFIEEYIQ